MPKKKFTLAEQLARSIRSSQWDTANTIFTQLMMEKVSRKLNEERQTLLSEAKIWKMQYHTGPTQVKHWAQKFKSAGFDALEGTEHVIVMCPDRGDGWGAIGAWGYACKKVGITSVKDEASAKILNPANGPELNEEYSISYAGKKGPVWATQVIAAAKKAGRQDLVKKVEDLQKQGTKYSNQDFDVLSFVTSELYKLGITYDDLIQFPRG